MDKDVSSDLKTLRVQHFWSSGPGEACYMVINSDLVNEDNVLDPDFVEALKDENRSLSAYRDTKFEIVPRPSDAWLAARFKHIRRQIDSLSAEFAYLDKLES